MARPWRIEFEGAVYHLMGRGNEGRAIMREDRDGEEWLALVGEAARRYRLSVFAYALMSNHYHLFLRTADPNLSVAMHWLNTTYTVRYNRRYDRIGHLFQGRYKAVLVEDPSHWSQLSIYIHLNPVRAGLCTDPLEYPWTSYRDFVRPKSRRPWLKRDEVLALYGPTHHGQRYAAHCRSLAGSENTIWKQLRYGFILGSEEFALRIKEKFLPDQPRPELPHQRALAKNLTPEQALVEVAAILSTEVDSLQERHWHHHSRDMAIALLHHRFALSNAAIAPLFHLTPSAITHVLHRHQTSLDNGRYLRMWGQVLKI